MKKLKLIWLGLRLFLLDWWGNRWEQYIEHRYKRTGRLSERRVLFVYRCLLMPTRVRQYVLVDHFTALKEDILRKGGHDADT